MAAPTFIRVSRDFKIEEAIRGQRRCLLLAVDPTAPLWPFQPRETPEEYIAHANTWQAIAISWASA